MAAKISPGMGNPRAQGVAGESTCVLGPPGSGKTTLFKHICMVMAGKGRLRKKHKVKRILPVLIPLRTLFPLVKENPDLTLGGAVERIFKKEQYPLPDQWIKQILDKTQTLVLLTGWMRWLVRTSACL